MTQFKPKISRKEEKHIKVSFQGNDCGDGFYGTAVIIDGELTKLEFKPSDYQFRRWFDTEARLELLRRFLRAVEKEIVYKKEETK